MATFDRGHVDVFCLAARNNQLNRSLRMSTNQTTIPSVKRGVLHIVVKLTSNASYVNEPPNKFCP